MQTCFPHPDRETSVVSMFVHRTFTVGAGEEKSVMAVCGAEAMCEECFLGTGAGSAADWTRVSGACR